MPIIDVGAVERNHMVYFFLQGFSHCFYPEHLKQVPKLAVIKAWVKEKRKTQSQTKNENHPSIAIAKKYESSNLEDLAYVV